MENAPATFQTSRPSSPLFCHPDFLTSLETYRTQPIGKRAALLLQRLLIDPERLHYKATQGDNKGWRRSRLGGSSGSHFYAWWAPKGSLPLQSHPGFADAPAGSLFLRDIRHHDDHSPMLSQRFPEDYLPITVPEVRQEDFGPAPWTTQQAKFANARDSVRVLKGHPGSGKTTALLHAADHTSSTNILYLTYSADLASLARTYFDRYCSNSREYHVTTFPHFLRAFLNVDLPIPPLAELRQRFRVEIVSQSRSLGPWANDLPALFDEFHAHVIGGALPAIVARFKAAPTQRMIEADYVARRSRSLGRGPAEQAHAAAVRLEKSAGPLAPRLFPDLHLAWTAIAKLPELSASALPWDCIAIDECQDLTPIESFFIARLALRLRQLRGRPVPVLVAGDEAQTVRPTDFEWAWLNDIFHAELATPAVHKLSSNLRSPRQIAELINSVWDLYGYLDKQDRPSGQGWAAIDDDSPDQILYCAAAPGEDLSALLADLSSREGLALVAFGAPPPGLPQALSPSEIKGLDFHSVCIIDGGEQLQKIVNTMGSSDIEHLSRRLAIDQLRVAISRPTERLIWLDISPPPLRVAGSISFLNGKSRQSSHSALSSAALLKSLQEENLDLEERIQRCQEDARQYLSIRPDLAWSRAHQAVTLLGIASDRNAVQDPLTRKTAHLTLAEVCFSLALRKVKLSPELGNPPLLSEASMSATQAGEHALSALRFPGTPTSPTPRNSTPRSISCASSRTWWPISLRGSSSNSARSRSAGSIGSKPSNTLAPTPRFASVSYRPSSKRWAFRMRPNAPPNSKLAPSNSSSKPSILRRRCPSSPRCQSGTTNSKRAATKAAATLPPQPKRIRPGATSTPPSTRIAASPTSPRPLPPCDYPRRLTPQHPPLNGSRPCKLWRPSVQPTLTVSSNRKKRSCSNSCWNPHSAFSAKPRRPRNQPPKKPP